MRFEVRGLTTNLWVEGDPSRERTAMLVHGFSGSSEDWRALVPRLRAMDRAVVAVDLPGHGDTASPRDPLRYTMAETSRDLDAILDHLGIPEADWIGYSLGGRVALHFALTYPERVRSLVLESASPGIENPLERERRRKSDDALARRIEERGIEWFADYWGALPLFETQWELPPATVAALRARRLRNAPHGLAGSLRGIGQGAHEYLGGRLGELRSEVLFLAGERDPKYAELSRRSQHAVPGASCVVVPGAGHTVHLERPEAFVEALAAHWRVAAPPLEPSPSS